GEEKKMVQKSGYYSRAAAPIAKDLELIQACAKKGVECALAGIGGVIGEDEDRNGELRACEFPRIKGGKPFDIDCAWFRDLLAAIGQPVAAKVSAE
ncbi:MAG: pyrophosphate--fructose-6-phosphate 1-phosphotransferase, partial [Kiritimatiellae bacterium]|nr:pyrophosphate--fructose-6-phosphate 1-phosphotransferase [Kiritimatiellia bacterium]